MSRARRLWAPVSVVVPVKNEEPNIGPCLESLTWADEVFVVDSQSTDRTAEIAAAYTNHVIQFKYQGGWPKKKNWALENLPFRNEWVLIVDADERVSPELRDEIVALFEEGPDKDGYYVKWKFMFLGRWLKHGGWYPTWNLRLFKHQLGRYERLPGARDETEGDVEVHEHVVLRGDAGYLHGHLLHHSFKDLHDWLDKHNRYSTWAARVRSEAGGHSAGGQGAIKAALFGTQVQRRRWLRRFMEPIPGKPILLFFYTYLLRGGFLDGKPGFIYCMLKAIQEFHISCKLYEMRLEEQKRRAGGGKRAKPEGECGPVVTE